MPDKLALWHTNFLQLFHRRYFMAVYHDYFHVFLAIQTSLWHDISGNVNPKKLFVPGKLMRFWLTLLNGWPYYRPRKLFFLFPLCFRFRFSCLCFFFVFFSVTVILSSRISQIRKLMYSSNVFWMIGVFYCCYLNGKTSV